ncbi:hypothetical protein [Plebeiibacterium sediminum]|uniref:PorT family protein n=1 Tax=Plebeiibacterium sediminum TaxID=2992112 RepID=A0AAE3SGL6_9BACT|nr:hypothetical protein [Plebeiobacterium sediminum]MCW3788237.1 PorT family protein [Plebeiobacterium sediminum]
MNKLLFIVVLLSIIGIESNAQVIFEKGYFINKEGQKTECFIKNSDWRNNPSSFDFQTTLGAQTQKKVIEDVKEFCIYNQAKFVSGKVQIDRSSSSVDQLSSDRNPVFEEETLFLKVLVEGKASLYSYQYGNLKRFFIQIQDSPIEQLIYKCFEFQDRIQENNSYKNQIITQLKCTSIGFKEIENLRYDKNQLEQIFVKYNDCSNSTYTVYESKRNTDFFHLSIRPGITNNNFDMEKSGIDYRDSKFENKIGFRLGAELELVLPFNKNKWSVFAEPTFQYLKAETSRETDMVFGGKLITKINYNAVELPIGVRHYFFLNDKSKLFVNGCALVNVMHNSELKFEQTNGAELSSLDISSNICLGIGAGYKYDKYSLEVRYYLNRDILTDYVDWNSNFKSLNIVFGYTLF